MVVLLRRTRRIASLVNSGTTTLQTLDYRNDEALPRERLSPVADLGRHSVQTLDPMPPLW